MKSRPFFRASIALLLVVTLGAFVAVVSDWTSPLPCRRVGDRMIC
jgi:hypothetical protein